MSSNKKKIYLLILLIFIITGVLINIVPGENISCFLNLCFNDRKSNLTNLYQYFSEGKLSREYETMRPWAFYPGLFSKNHQVKILSAIGAYQGSKKQGYAQIIFAGLRSPDPYVRALSVSGLAWIKEGEDSPYTNEIISLLNNEVDSDVIDHIFFFFKVNSSDKNVIIALSQMALNSKSERIRNSCIMSMISFVTPKVIHILKQSAMSDTSPLVRRSAIHILKFYNNDDKDIESIVKNRISNHEICTFFHELLKTETDKTNIEIINSFLYPQKTNTEKAFQEQPNGKAGR